jgi:subtilisin family serine protease
MCRDAEDRQVRGYREGGKQLQDAAEFRGVLTGESIAWNVAAIGAGPGTTALRGDQTSQKPIIVAIIDDGFDTTHRDLKDSFTDPQTHFNYHDWAYRMRLSDPSHDPPMNAGPFDATVDRNGRGEKSGHGTVLAGIVAAQKHGTEGIHGIAAGCKILPVRVAPRSSAKKIAAGIDWAVANGARVINLSLEIIAAEVVSDAIDRAWQENVIICAAAGNDDAVGVDFPAALERVIAVGAVDQTCHRKTKPGPGHTGEAWGSNYGNGLDVMAPGIECLTTDETGPRGYNDNWGGPILWNSVRYPFSGDTGGHYFAHATATSIATAHVSALAALILLHDSGLRNTAVREIIESTCQKVHEGTGPGTYRYENTRDHPNGSWNEEMGYGLINVTAALEKVLAHRQLSQQGGAPQASSFMRRLQPQTILAQVFSVLLGRFRLMTAS